jgi:general secretion pathway protein F
MTSSAVPSAGISGLENAVNLAIGLRLCAEELDRGEDRRRFRQLARQLEDGEPLDVLANSPADSRGFAALVQAGAQSGRLGHVLEEYCRSTREIRRLWRTLFVSLLYPGLILLIAATVMSLFLILTVPQMRNIYGDFGVELPWLTRFVIWLGEALLAIWPLLFVMLLLCAILVVFGAVLPGRRIRQRLFRILPLIGSAYRNASAAEFCSRLSVLIDARLPLPMALKLVATSLHDQVLGAVCARTAHRLEEGIPPRELALGIRGMPPTLAGSFRWADDGEMYANGLRSLGEVFAVQSRIRAEQFGFFVAPLTFGAIGFMACLLVLSYFTPLVKLLNTLS